MKEYRINKEINSKFIRLPNENDLISLPNALKRAIENNTDLIELSVYTNNEQISICTFQNYQKFLYQQRKREKELKAGQIKIITKELRFGPHIDNHDYTFKLKHAKDFLLSKARVRACVIFHGREIIFKEQGETILLRLATDLENIAKIEAMPKLEGKRMNMVLIPK